MLPLKERPSLQPEKLYKRPGRLFEALRYSPLRKAQVYDSGNSSNLYFETERTSEAKKSCGTFDVLEFECFKIVLRLIKQEHFLGPVLCLVYWPCVSLSVISNRAPPLNVQLVSNLRLSFKVE